MIRYLSMLVFPESDNAGFFASMTTTGIFPLMLIRRSGLPTDWLDEMVIDHDVFRNRMTELENAAREARDYLLRLLDDRLNDTPDGPQRTLVYNCRKTLYQRNTIPPGLYGKLPAPLQKAADHFQSLQNQQQTAWHEFALQYKKELENNIGVALTAARDEGFRRGLAFASHALLNTLLQDGPPSNAKKSRQFALSLVQYLSRSSLKTSPFGQFTTVGMPGKLYEKDQNITPNAALLPIFYEILLQSPAATNSLELVLNPCITQAESPLRWIYFDGLNESIQESALNPALKFLIDRLSANRRRESFAALCEAIREKTNASAEQSRNYLLDLAETGLLEWVWPVIGTTDQWALSLLNWLDQLPPDAHIRACQDALERLTANARTLATTPAHQIPQIVSHDHQYLEQAFSHYGLPLGNMPKEHLYYEDCWQSGQALPEDFLQEIAQTLRSLFQTQSPPYISPQRARALAIARSALEKKDTIPWMEFCQLYFDIDPGAEPGASASALQKADWIGVLFQPCQINGRRHAVLNALYPGGGKMFARWMPFLSPADSHAVAEHIRNADGSPFPWFGWHNANFQPDLPPGSLDVPGSRSAFRGSPPLLGQVALKMSDEGPMLVHTPTGKPVRLNDLGLEATDNKPPAVQLLYFFTTSPVSVNTFRRSRKIVQTEFGAHMPRVSANNLILAREAWQLNPNCLERLLRHKEERFFHETARWMAQNKLPARFFARVAGQKPQYFDHRAPLLMALLEKMLRQSAGPLEITEALPSPEHYPDKRAVEYVMEFRISG